MGVLQLKITLNGIKPKIWRRFLVSDNISFHQLHNIIQDAMGWGNYHLYSFIIDGVRIELPDEEAYSESKNSKKIKLFNYLTEEKQKLEYDYDFGDGWRHELIVEKILEDLPNEVNSIPFCI